MIGHQPTAPLVSSINANTGKQAPGYYCPTSINAAAAKPKIRPVLVSCGVRVFVWGGDEGSKCDAARPSARNPTLHPPLASQKHEQVAPAPVTAAATAAILAAVAAALVAVAAAKNGAGYDELGTE